MTHMDTANEILRQLGGNRFCSFVGVKSLVAVNELRGGLVISLKKCDFLKDGINTVKIVCNGSDLYDIEFARVWGKKRTVIEAFSDVYNDQLVDLWEDRTGLITSF